MNWKSIRLELGCTAEFPSGSVSRAYLVRLPLDGDGRVDGTEVERHPNLATFRRHWSSDPDERGQVAPNGAAWHLDCTGKKRTLSFGSKPIRLGTKVLIREPNGDVLPFRVASIL